MSRGCTRSKPSTTRRRARVHLGNPRWWIHDLPFSLTGLYPGLTAERQLRLQIARALSGPNDTHPFAPRHGAFPIRSRSNVSFIPDQYSSDTLLRFAGIFPFSFSVMAVCFFRFPLPLHYNRGCCSMFRVRRFVSGGSYKEVWDSEGQAPRPTMWPIISRTHSSARIQRCRPMECQEIGRPHRARGWIVSFSIHFQVCLVGNEAHTPVKASAFRAKGRPRQNGITVYSTLSAPTFAANKHSPAAGLHDEQPPGRWGWLRCSIAVERCCHCCPSCSQQSRPTCPRTSFRRH